MRCSRVSNVRDNSEGQHATVQVGADCVAALQILKQRDAAGTGTKEEKKYEQLYYGWLSGCAKRGVEVVGVKVRIAAV